MPNELLTASEVATWLHVHVRTLHRIRERGEGPPAYRVGGAFRYRKADVEAWLEGRASAPNSSEAALVGGSAKMPVTAGNGES